MSKKRVLGKGKFKRVPQTLSIRYLMGKYGLGKGDASKLFKLLPKSEVDVLLRLVREPIDQTTKAMIQVSYELKIKSTYNMNKINDLAQKSVT